MVSEAASGTTRASLLSRARSRDPDAWRELVELYGPLVAHWCYRCGLDSHSTADCVQDVFAAVAGALQRYEPKRASGAFRSWLWTISANKLRDVARRERRQVRPVGGSTALQRLRDISDAAVVPDEEPSATRELERLAARGLEQVRAEFEPRSWAIFQRAVIDQLPTANVAAEFQITPAAVRQIRSRILRRLRQQLGDLA